MPTIEDIARLSKVSRGTVSNYLNGKKIKQSSEQKIEKVIKEINYKPSNIGKFLRMGRTKTIGILTCNLKSNFFTDVILYIDNYFNSLGYETIICNADDDSEKEKRKLNFLTSQLVDAIIVYPIYYTHSDFKKINTGSIPIVLADKLIKNHEYDAVVLNNTKICYDATEIMIKNGHKKIGYISGIPDNYTVIERLKGYKAALKANNIKINENYIAMGNYSEESGYEMTLKILQNKEPPTAFILTNNHILPGFLLALEKNNLKIPDDVSYFLFDRPEYYHMLKPMPSSIIHPAEKMGEELVKMISNILESPDAKEEKTIIKLDVDLDITDTIRKI